MNPLLLLLLLCLGLAQGWPSKQNKSLAFVFWRRMNRDWFVPTRRVYGGNLADIQEFPRIAALLDAHWSTRCSATVIADYWALTAGHCLSAQIIYVLYNSRRSNARDNYYTPILSFFRHPQFKAIQKLIQGRLSVTLLHHDLGLIRTQNAMAVSVPSNKILKEMHQYSRADLMNEEVTVMGYGRTETLPAGENLFSVKLVAEDCNVRDWIHCFCGVGKRSSFRGVCCGDSGGPVIYRGVQVGVASMGPIECELRMDLDTEAPSVFTSLYEYVYLINSTINNIYSTNNNINSAINDVNIFHEVFLQVPLATSNTVKILPFKMAIILFLLTVLSTFVN